MLKNNQKNTTSKNTIPKILIQTWKTKRLPPDLKKWSESWKRINPDFTYLFFDDRDCFKFVFNYYPQYLDLYESLTSIEKADLFRYLALHKYGGVYIDMDTSCFKPLDPLISLLSTSLITGIEYHEPLQYLQWFIACPKDCKVMIELADEINRRTWFRFFKSLKLTPNELVYYTTGPVMYTQVIRNTKEQVSVLEKGKLGAYDQRYVNKDSYLQHYFIGSWKIKKCKPLTNLTEDLTPLTHELPGLFDLVDQDLLNTEQDQQDRQDRQTQNQYIADDCIQDKV